MSKGRYSAADFAESIGAKDRRLRGMLRRMVVRATKRVLWQLEGHKLPNGVTEPAEAEVFSGVGFYARPRTSSRAEAIMAAIGDAQHVVIIATRDEDLRKRWASALDRSADVAAMFNSAAITLIKDSTVEIRSRTGELLVEPTIKATTYRTAEDTLLTALSTVMAAISTFAANCTGPTAPQLTALQGAITTFAAAITAFQATASAYLTTVLKVE